MLSAAILLGSLRVNSLNFNCLFLILQWDFTMMGGILFVFLIVLICFGLLCAIIRNRVSIMMGGSSVCVCHGCDLF